MCMSVWPECLDWLKWNIITHEIFKETDIKRKKDVEVWSSKRKNRFIYIRFFSLLVCSICAYALVNGKKGEANMRNKNG